MDNRSQLEVILTVVAFIGWTAAGAVLLRRGAGPGVWQEQAPPSYARRASFATFWFLLLVVSVCVMVLKLGLRPAHLSDFLLLRDIAGLRDVGNLAMWRSRLYLGTAYLVYLVALFTPNTWLFWLRELNEPNRFQQEPPVGKSVDVAVEWQQTRDRFRSRNRRWVIAGLAWVATVGAVLASSSLGLATIGEYLYSGVLLLILVGFVAIIVASMALPSLLVCPNCGCSPCRRSYNVHRWLDEIRVCEKCRAKLA